MLRYPVAALFVCVCVSATSCALFSHPSPGSDGGSDGEAGQAIDAGRVDAGRVDAGRVDAGPVDAGRVDAGRRDAGTDGGRPDGGVDAGPPCMEPRGCCCEGDVVYEVVCVGGSWQCEPAAEENSFAEYLEPGECECGCTLPWFEDCCDDAGTIIGQSSCETGWLCTEGSTELCSGP